MMRTRWRVTAPSLVLGLAVASVAAQDAGQNLYLRHCLACHGADGSGAMPGVSDLTDPAGVLAKTDAVLLRSLIDGVQRPGAPLAMPPKGGNPALTQSDLRAVLTFLRREFDARSKPPTGDK